LRQLAATVLSVPVLAIVYAGTLVRRSIVARAALAVGAAGLVAAGAFWFGGPTATTATPPTIPVPLTDGAFRAMSTGGGLDARIAIEFTTPMDATSVAANLEIDPPTAVELAWDDAFRRLTVTPSVRWAPDTLHTITVMPGALARTGRPLAVPVREAFLTRPTTAGRIAPTDQIGDRTAIDSAFEISFDRTVDAISVVDGLRVEPAVEGVVTSALALDGLPRFTFTPSEPLKADSRYRLVLSGVRDDEGAAVDRLALDIRTATAPTVVRFRPRDGSDAVARDAAISVRFTEPMDRATTRKAFGATVDGEAVAGKTSFAEGDTVLVFVPEKNLPYDAKVVMAVGGSALSATGVQLAAAAEGTFETVPKPAPVEKAPPSGGGGGGGSSGGGSAGSGSWAAVEEYYLGLMNCTRTGGLVDSSGDCTSPGGRDVAPLKLDAGISNKVARPYAKLLATRNLCSHFIGGSPGDRLRRAGYTNYTWAENLGCRSGKPMSAVLASHLYFQSERSWSPQGGHYRNLMSTKYDRVGIGVWVSSGRVRLVVNFYHP
jgi:uncharacterized protein YkwD